MKTITPCLLLFSLFLGFTTYAQQGLQQEMGTYSPWGSYTIDPQQDLYISGSITEDDAAETTLSENAIQSTFGGGDSDAYIEKRNVDGEVLWNTFFGGEGTDAAQVIGFNEDAIYILGSTNSTTGIATPGTFQEEFLPYEWGGNTADTALNYYLAKLDPTTGEQIWGTYFRSTDADNITEYIMDAAVAPDGSVYIVGHTQSEENIATDEAFDGTIGESLLKGYIQKFDADGNREWGTYYGSSNSRDIDATYLRQVAVDQNGDVLIGGYFMGITPESYFVTPGVYNDGLNKAYDIFLAKFNPDGNRIWGLMYGGENQQTDVDLKIDSQNNILLLGFTKSLEDIATPGAHQETLGSSNPVNNKDDAFLAKFDPEGQLLWGTYYGGHKEDSHGSSYGAVEGSSANGFQALTIDDEDHIFITGQTKSQENIAMPGVYQDSLTQENKFDAYVAKFTSEGAREWGTYFGGNGNDTNTGVLYAGDDNFFLFGTTSSEEAIATENAWWENELSEEESYFLNKFSIGEMSTPTFENSQFTLYPNPSKGSIHISGVNFSTAQITVYDLQGRKVGYFPKATPDEALTLNVENGVYFVHIQTEYSYQTKKLIVE